MSTQGIKNKSTRSKKRKYLDEIYNTHIDGIDVDLKAKELNLFFNVMGWK